MHATDSCVIFHSTFESVDYSNDKISHTSKKKSLYRIQLQNIITIGPILVYISGKNSVDTYILIF